MHNDKKPLKNRLITKFVKNFMGISGPLDEYKLSQINHIGRNAYIMLFYLELIMNVILLYVIYEKLLFTAIIIIGINIAIMLLGINTYIIVASHKAKLNDIEVPDSKFKATKRKIIRQSIYSTIFFTIFMYLASAVQNIFLQSYQHYFLSLKPIMSALLGGIMFGIIISIVSILRVRKAPKL